MYKTDTKKLAVMGLLTAIVVVLQIVVHIQIGIFSLSTVLIPIVIGGALYGVLAGAWLGLVFAAAVFISGDAAFFLGITIPGTIVTVTAKGIACGAAAAAVYRLFVKKNRQLAGLMASIAAPVVNTAVFIIGCLIFFNYGMAYILTAFVGINFFIELAFNILLSQVVMFIINYARRRVTN